MIRVIRAAAGCGKTTALAQAYLRYVSLGIPVDRIIAITFTRRAAAELVERVGTALRAAAGDVEALEHLGGSAPLYLDVAPNDPDVARAALADLASAPIGTTDHFINDLLAEFALHAELPLPDGRVVPLDIGLVPVPDLSAHLEAAARERLDPADAEPTADIQLLTRYFSLGDILSMVRRASALDGMPTALCSNVLQWVAVQVARTLEPLDLPVLLELQGDRPEGWLERLDAVTNKGAEWTYPRVAQWLFDGAIPSDAPQHLVPWIRKLDRRGKQRRTIWALLSQQSLDFGITEVRLDHVLAALRHPYEDPAHLELADQLRDAVNRLRVDVSSAAIEAAALQGELTHDHLTRAATRLARNPVVFGRYEALLVDEVQDANPDQLALYEALLEQPGMENVFVGDARQSIYLFRDGEPAGLASLTERAQSDGLVEPRMVNFRSTPSLVHAHQHLFTQLDAPLLKESHRPLDSLAGSMAAAENAHLELDEPAIAFVHSEERTWKADHQGLVTFFERVARAREQPGHEQDTAAVLCPTWALAESAALLLRSLAENEEAAWVEGGDRWLGTGVGRDVGLWLRALLDASDDVAWLAVWKHPSIGLTDGALARIRAGVGVQGWDGGRPLGVLVHSEGLVEPHLPSDIDALAVALPALRKALSDIGREDTSTVLDHLFSSLHWRVIVAASPDGDDELARLDAVLDWLGEADAAGTGVDTLAQMLSAERRLEAPRVGLERGPTTITCTTVFQAKGLAWDHVAVMSPGRSGRTRVDPDTVKDLWVDIGSGPVRLSGLTFDPTGGLLPYQDPLKRLAVTIHTARHTEEGARLAYVALTRARRSLTMALPARPRKSQIGRMSPAQLLIASAWRDVVHPAVAHVPAPPLPETRAREAHGVVARSALPPAPEPVHVFHEMAPSASAARYDKHQRQAVARHIHTRVELAGGFYPGTKDLPPPTAARPEFEPSDWGTLAHSWFARWGFRDVPSREALDTWMVEEWGSVDPDVGDWLLSISRRLRRRKGPLWEMVHHPKSRLMFEHPLVGIGGSNDDLLLAGRIDLLVVRPRGCIIVDFKAGSKSPASMDDLIRGASLQTYGPQLDSYRGALERMGHRVLQTSLWFARTGACVSWS